jgi:transmembrane sensor
MTDSAYWSLIAKYLSDKASKEEEELLFNWVNASPQNKKKFEHAQGLWNHMPVATESYTPDTEKLWNELKIQLLTNQPEKNIMKSKSRNLQWMIAASVLLLAIGYLFVTSIKSNTISITTGDNIEVIYLPDSSLIWINKNSRISFPKKFSNSERIVYLEGEAFFKVTRDSLKPFKIFADQCVTTVLGTSFNIKAYENDKNVEVTVASGKVNLSIIKDTVKDHFLILKPHERGMFNKNNLTITHHTNKDVNYAEWKGNIEDLKKTVLYEKEAKNPLQYLRNDYQWRQNLLKQTIIDGEIDNNAALVAFKDIKFKVIYYSHGGDKLATKYFMINSVIGPGKTLVYSYKLDHWFSNTTKVIVEVEGSDITENEIVRN